MEVRKTRSVQHIYKQITQTNQIVFRICFIKLELSETAEQKVSFEELELFIYVLVVGKCMSEAKVNDINFDMTLFVI